MPCDLLHRLGELIIHLINAFLLLILRRARYDSLFNGCITDVQTMFSLIGDSLGDDILRSLKSLLHRFHLLLFFHVRPGHILLRLDCKLLCRILRKNILSKAIQSLLLCNAGPRLSLGTIRTIQILHHDHGLGRKNLLLQFWRQLTLLTDAAEHLLLLLLQISQINQTLMQISELLVI